MIGQQQRLLLFRRRMTTGRFINELKAVSPGNVRLLWIPSPADATTNLLRPDGRVHTNSTTIQGRITYQGRGILVSFNGTDQYVTTPDTPDLSIDDSGGAGPFSIAALVAIEATADNEIIIAKSNNSNAMEWSLEGDATATLRPRLAVYKSDASAQERDLTSALTSAKLSLVGASYNGVGGTGASAGMSMFINGAQTSDTLNDTGTYVAMSNTTQIVSIGAYSDGSKPFKGKMGFVAFYAANLTGAQHRHITNRASEYYEVNL